MQPSTNLKRKLRALFMAIETEVEQNPAFAAQLGEILTQGPSKRRGIEHGATKRLFTSTIPDVFVALQEKGDEEFRFWLRTLDRSILKAIVKQNGFDPARVSQRWKDHDKFIALVDEQTHLRLKRGSSFLPVRGS
jgi:hypothetical protein